MGILKALGLKKSKEIECQPDETRCLINSAVRDNSQAADRLLRELTKGGETLAKGLNL